VAGEERYELPPERLGRWLERWAEAHGGVAEAISSGTVVRFVARDGAVVECEPPFPPVEGDLLAHVGRERVVGVLLVRLGGHAAGVFRGARLLDSKVGARPVHGRNRKGGSSSGRFARRRAGQAGSRSTPRRTWRCGCCVRRPRPGGWKRSCWGAIGAR